MKTLKTSDKIEFHPDLGVHKTYKGFKWQPDFGGSMVSFVRPGKRKFEFVVCGSVENFFKMVDQGRL